MTGLWWQIQDVDADRLVRRSTSLATNEFTRLFKTRLWLFHVGKQIHSFNFTKLNLKASFHYSLSLTSPNFIPSFPGSSVVVVRAPHKRTAACHRHAAHPIVSARQALLPAGDGPHLLGLHLKIVNSNDGPKKIHSNFPTSPKWIFYGFCHEFWKTSPGMEGSPKNGSFQGGGLSTNLKWSLGLFQGKQPKKSDLH